MKSGHDFSSASIGTTLYDYMKIPRIRIPNEITRLEETKRLVKSTEAKQKLQTEIERLQIYRANIMQETTIELEK